MTTPIAGSDTLDVIASVSSQINEPQGDSTALSKRIVIVGGGLAGIAAALRLAEAGCVPVVLESSKRLGGRATSFVDPRTGQVLDNCQHVLLGCCTNLIDLYERLNVLDQITWHRELFWTKGNGRIDRLRAGWLPAPLHLAGAFKRLTIFDRTDKRAIRRAMWRMIRLGAKGRFAWRDKTFAQFLHHCQQPESTMRRFWNTIIVSACNLDINRVSAAYAIQIFQDGFLAHRWSYTMGISSVPLIELYDPATELIESSGGEVRLGTTVKAIQYDGKRISGVVTNDGFIEAAAVITTVPFDRLSKIVSTAMRTADQRLGKLDQFTISPILGVHLTFDQPIMDLPHLVLVDSGVQWLFNKGLDEHGRQHLHAVISAADDWMERSEPEIVELTVRDIHRALPDSIGIAPVEARAIKEKRATFACVPEVDAFRPSTKPGMVGIGGGGIENLYLAGDWIDTGWPATMESAVRSGYLAAKAVTGTGGLVDDVPPAFLARLLGLK